MAETWLPHEPTPPAPPRSSARRTLFLWLGLIILFVTIYAAFDASPQASHREPSSSSSSSWWIVPLCVACLAAPTALFIWLFGGSRRFIAQQTPAAEALGDGQFARAAQLYGDLARRFRTRPSFGLVAAFNQAYALTRDGQSAAAVGVLLTIERWPNPIVGGLRRGVSLELARAFAIGGDLDKAQRWLDAARAHEPSHDPGNDYAQLADIDGLILCRAGKLDDAIHHYEATWERLQSSLTIRNMRPVWLLRAFAATATGSPRDAAAGEPWLRLLQATKPTSLAWLTGHWPELAAFAAQHLGSASSRPAAAEARG